MKRYPWAYVCRALSSSPLSSSHLSSSSLGGSGGNLLRRSSTRPAPLSSARKASVAVRFGDDVADLVERAQELDDVPSNDRKRRLVDVVQDGNRSIPIGMKSGRRYTGEEDVPLRDTLGVRFFFSLFVLRRNFSSLFLEIRHHHIEASISLPRDLSLSNLVLK